MLGQDERIMTEEAGGRKKSGPRRPKHKLPFAGATRGSQAAGRRPACQSHADTTGPTTPSLRGCHHTATKERPLQPAKLQHPNTPRRNPQPPSRTQTATHTQAAQQLPARARAPCRMLAPLRRQCPAGRRLAKGAPDAQLQPAAPSSRRSHGRRSPVSPCASLGPGAKQGAAATPAPGLPALATGGRGAALRASLGAATLVDGAPSNGTHAADKPVARTDPSDSALSIWRNVDAVCFDVDCEQRVVGGRVGGCAPHRRWWGAHT